MNRTKSFLINVKGENKRLKNSISQFEKYKIEYEVFYAIGSNGTFNDDPAVKKYIDERNGLGKEYRNRNMKWIGNKYLQCLNGILKDGNAGDKSLRLTNLSLLKYIIDNNIHKTCKYIGVFEDDFLINDEAYKKIDECLKYNNHDFVICDERNNGGYLSHGSNCVFINSQIIETYYKNIDLGSEFERTHWFMHKNHSLWDLYIFDYIKTYHNSNYHIIPCLYLTNEPSCIK